MKMKPLPRLLLIIGAVGAAFYGINFFLSKGDQLSVQLPIQMTEKSPVEVTTQTKISPVEPAPMAKTPVTSGAVSTPQVDSALNPSMSTDGNAGTNAGLSNLLNSGTKK